MPSLTEHTLQPTSTGRESSPMERAESLPERVVLSIIVSNYNARELLRACLTSLYRHPPSYSFNIIVVDDASSDGSDAMVTECFPRVHVLRTERNLNYGGANNQALDFAQCEFVCLLNNDTVMLPHALDEMVAFLREHPKAGAVGCKLLNGDGSVQASVKTLPCLLSGLFGYRSPVTKLFPGNRFSRQHLLHLSRDMTRPFTAGYVSSACMIMPQEVVKKVGHLDIRLTYHVDADYCKRIWDAGWDVYYLPTAVVIHDAHKGGTMVNIRRRLKSVVEFHRGSYIYFQKHQMKSVWEPMHLVVVAGLAVRFIMSLLLQTSKEMLRPFHSR